jgi:hypothetical protein
MAALLLAAAVSSVLPLSAEAALATTTPSTPGVIPPTVSVQGRTYSQWSVAQWQWELEQPNNPQSPVVDPNPGTASNPEPVDCTLDQSGSVWFLAGISVSQNYQTAYRACSIPSGKYLFFPVVDGWNDNLNCPDLGNTTVTPGHLKQNVRRQTDGIVPGSMNVTLDGNSVAGLQDSKTGYRAAADGFFYTLPANSWLSAAFCPPPHTPFPSGTMPPPPGAFADGVYIMLAPLPVGVHHLSFAAQETSGPLGPANQNVTYTITVTP